MSDKVHYAPPFDVVPLCGRGNSMNIKEDHEQATCVNCIKKMEDNERAWHDWNNKEWIAFVERDDGWTMGR